MENRIYLGVFCFVFVNLKLIVLKDPVVVKKLMDPIEKVKAWKGIPDEHRSQLSKLRKIITVNHDGAWREEIEVELRNLFILKVFFLGFKENLIYLLQINFLFRILVFILS